MLSFFLILEASGSNATKQALEIQPGPKEDGLQAKVVRPL
jgi:hypothetical protein